MDANEIAELIDRYSIPTIVELDMQNMIEKVFCRHRVPYQREHSLSVRDRVDFLCGKVAIECKVDGSPALVLTQLQRYAEHECVEQILLVTSRVEHEFEDSVSGKLLKVLRARQSFG